MWTEQPKGAWIADSYGLWYGKENGLAIRRDVEKQLDGEVGSNELQAAGKNGIRCQ